MNTRAAALTILLSCLFLLNPEQICAQQAQPAGAWEISADRITHQTAPRVVVAEGNVLLTPKEKEGRESFNIKADFIRYNVDEAMVEARGNLVITSGEDVITAREAVFDLNRLTGTIKKTTLFLAESKLYFQGEVLEKKGDLAYRLLDGWITACKAPEKQELPWKIMVGQADLTLEGYAILRDASLRIKEVPLLYTPYFILPAKTKRETGFLFPEFSQSERDGTGVIAPFFVNISPSVDMTLYPGYLARRGVFAGAEFRYMASPESKGALALNYLDDKKEEKINDEYKSDGYLRQNRDRYWLRGKIDHDFGNDLAAKLDLDVVSDRDYLQEYRKGLIGFDQSNEDFYDTFHRDFQEETVTFRESTVQLAKNFPAMLLAGEVRAVSDVRDEPQTQTHIQTLPRIVFNGRKGIDDIPLRLAWDSEYANFWRHEGYGANRFDVHPRLITPLPFGLAVEGTVNAGVRETAYFINTYGDTTPDWHNSDSQTRESFDLEANIATPLARDYPVSLGSMHAVNHLLRPEITYSYVSSSDQHIYPEFDDTDRLLQKNWFTYGVSNYFKIKGESASGERFSRNGGFFKIHQTYSIKEERRTLYSPADKKRPFSDIYFDLEVLPRENLRLEYTTALGVHGQGVSQYDFLARYDNIKGDRLSLDYRYNKSPESKAPYFFQTPQEDSLHEINVSGRKIFSELVSLEGDITHSLANDDTVEASLRLNYTPPCWAVQVFASKTPDDHRIALIFSLPNFGKVMGLGFSQ